MALFGRGAGLALGKTRDLLAIGMGSRSAASRSRKLQLPRRCNLPKAALGLFCETNPMQSGSRANFNKRSPKAISARIESLERARLHRQRAALPTANSVRPRLPGADRCFGARGPASTDSSRGRS